MDRRPASWQSRDYRSRWRTREARVSPYLCCMMKPNLWEVVANTKLDQLLQCFAFDCRAEEVFKKLQIEWSPDEPRTPVLAVGSNAGPEQLLRKYPPVFFPNGVLIPCVRCILPDFDVAYSPCITSYGSCSGTTAFSTTKGMKMTCCEFGLAPSLSPLGFQILRQSK